MNSFNSVLNQFIGSGEIGSPPKVILSDSPTPEVQNGGIHWVADIPLKDPKGKTTIDHFPDLIL